MKTKQAFTSWRPSTTSGLLSHTVRYTMPQTKWRRLLVVATLIALMLATVATVTACSGVEKRNAEAKQAVAYENGEGFLAALSNAGITYTNPTISAVSTSVGAMVLDYADDVECSSEGSYLRAQVVYSTVNEEIATFAFASGVENYIEAASKYGAGMVLKGNLWYVTGDDQTLFDVQEALGGQLIEY